MAHVIQRPVVNNPPNLQRYVFPRAALNPDAKENIFPGKKVCEITDLSEYKNYALATLAIGLIFLVGSITAFSLGQIALSTAFTYTALSCGMAGSLYFIVKHLFNPLSSLESQREKMRFLPLEKVLDKSLETVEGLDLLKKAIEDKSTNPKDKAKTYIVLRQLKRAYENLKVQKKQFEENVSYQYSARVENLKIWKDQETKAIYVENPRMAAQVIEADLREVNRLYNESIENWLTWKRDSLNSINEQYNAGMNQLESQYQALLGHLGEKKGFFAFWK